MREEEVEEEVEVSLAPHHHALLFQEVEMLKIRKETGKLKKHTFKSPPNER